MDITFIILRLIVLRMVLFLIEYTNLLLVSKADCPLESVASEMIPFTVGIGDVCSRIEDVISIEKSVDSYVPPVNGTNVTQVVNSTIFSQTERVYFAFSIKTKDLPMSNFGLDSVVVTDMVIAFFYITLIQIEWKYSNSVS